MQGEIRFDAGSRGAYSTDASNYRQVPIAVVIPHSVEAGAEAVAVSAVAVPLEPLCCGLTRISTGQLGIARRKLRGTVSALRPWIEAGHLVVGLEPSCTAVFRHDAAELLPEDEDVARLGARFVTLAEALLEHAPRPWQPARFGRRALVQAHCHQHAVLGFDADLEVMARAGIDASRLDSGCCGLAGNFGFEAGHHDVSMACAEQALLPAVLNAAPDTLVIADGFSCRTQIEQGGTGRRPVHLAEALRFAPPAPPAVAEQRNGYRTAAAAAAAGVLATAGAAWAARKATRGAR